MAFVGAGEDYKISGESAALCESVREYHIEGDPAEAAKVYEAYLAIGHYYVEGAEELLKHLSEKYRLYMVTNGTLSVQKGRIKSAGMRPYFKDIFISRRNRLR